MTPVMVLHAGCEVRVCWTEVDCPERGQPFGQKARDATVALALGKVVTVVTEWKVRGLAVKPESKHLPKPGTLAPQAPLNSVQSAIVSQRLEEQYLERRRR
jgi:hypothetical protein